MLIDDSNEFLLNHQYVPNLINANLMVADAIFDPIEVWRIDIQIFDIDKWFFNAIEPHFVSNPRIRPARVEMTLTDE